MADGSSQTIDRIQVEFSTNLEDLMRDLSVVEQRLQTTTSALATAEISSQKFAGTTRSIGTAANTAAVGVSSIQSSATTYSTVIQKVGDYTATTVKSLDRFRAAAPVTGDAITTMTTAAGEYSQAASTVGETTEYATDQLREYTVAATTQADAARTATTEVANQGVETSRTFTAIKEGFGQVKSVLGMLGASISLGALISQIKQLQTAAEDAGKAYGKMYNTIYYTIGELTESQQTLAKSLKLEGFNTTDVAETISRLSVLFPDAESTVLENGQTALAQMAEEVLWMDRKSYGDVSSIIDGMTSAFKKWKIPVEDTPLALSYLRATYQDTNVDVETQLRYMTLLDEVGTALNMTYRDMADFIGAANIAGNIEDLSNVGTTFETQYGNKISTIKEALIAGDMSALATYIDAFKLDSGKISGMFDEIASEIQIDPVLAKTKAEEFATELTQEIFQAANRKAAETGSKTQAAEIWKDVLDLDSIRGSRIANALADFSLSGVPGYTDVKTTQRDIVTEKGQTTTILVTEDKGLGTSDYSAKNTAAKEEALSNTWWGSKTPKVEKKTSEYIDEGKDYWNSYALANIDTESAHIAAYLMAEWATVTGLVSGAGQKIAGWFETLSPVGVASAADDVVFNPDWNPLGKSGLAGSGTQQAADEATFVPGWSGQDSVDNTTPLDKINTSVAGMKTSLDNMTSWLTNMSPVVTVNQYIYSPTADSYTIKNAATMAVNTSQAGSYKLRA